MTGERTGETRPEHDSGRLALLEQTQASATVRRPRCTAR